jgi:hypothetical protein
MCVKYHLLQWTMYHLLFAPYVALYLIEVESKVLIIQCFSLHSSSKHEVWSASEHFELQ